jgi:rhomboid protease GluP
MTLTPRVIATPAIVVVNILVFAAMIASGVNFFAPSVQSAIEWGANFGPKTIDGQWWRLVTSMFLHYGILHLAFNMWILWDLGRIVERLVGSVGFLLLYFVSGIAASIASLAWKPTVVSAGASGAVFGVAGALLAFLAICRDGAIVSELKRLRGSMAGFLGYNLLFGIMSPRIDMAAHVGGLVAGFACGLILSQRLSVDVIPRRLLRNAAVAVVGAIALTLAACALPHGLPDIDREMQHFADVEKRCLNVYRTLVEQAQRGAVNDADVAEVIEREVLPPWVESRRRIEGLLGLPYGNQRFLSRLVEYVRCREESWRLRVEGLRKQDPATCKQADDRWIAADKIAQGLSGTKEG